jgi:DNA modification methylase
MTDAERQARRRKRVGKTMNRQARTRYKQAKQGNEAQLRREASRAASPIPDGMDLRIGDAREVLAEIADNSVALLITDPPYGNEAEPLYEWLAQFAARVLITGGSLICYTGQGKLDRDMAILGARLKYWWLCQMPHTQSQKFQGIGVFVTFKPVLWFVKGHRRILPSGQRPLMTDEFISPSPDKMAHAWAQGEGGVWVPIEHLTEPGETIVDPFAGTATWGRIAVAMGRRWIGADVALGGSTMIAA